MDSAPCVVWAEQWEAKAQASNVRTKRRWERMGGTITSTTTISQRTVRRSQNESPGMIAPMTVHNLHVPCSRSLRSSIAKYKRAISRRDPLHLALPPREVGVVQALHSLVDLPVLFQIGIAWGDQFAHDFVNRFRWLCEMVDVFLPLLCLRLPIVAKLPLVEKMHLIGLWLPISGGIQSWCGRGGISDISERSTLHSL